MVNKLEKWLFYLLIIVLPFQTRTILYSVTPVFNEWTSAYLYLTDIILITVLFLWLIRIRQNRFLKSENQPRIKKPGFWLAFFLIVAFGSLINALSLKLGLYQLAKLIEFALLFGYIQANLGKLISIYRIGQFFILGAVGQCLIALLQFAGQKSLGLGWLTESPLAVDLPGVAKIIVNGLTFIRPYAGLPHPNVLAAYLAIALLFSFYLFFDRKRSSIKACFFLSSAALMLFILGLTFSRSESIIFLGLSLIYLGGLFIKYFKKNKLLRSDAFLILGVIILVGLIFFGLANTEIASRYQVSAHEQAFNLRSFYISAASITISDSPLLGYGLGNYILELKQILNLLADWLHQPVHNIYLFMAAEVGLLGLVVFLLFIWRLIAGFWKSQDFLSKHTVMAMLGFILVTGLFDHYYLTLQQGQLMLWLVLGLIKCSTSDVEQVGPCPQAKAFDPDCQGSIMKVIFKIEKPRGGSGF